MLYAQEFCATHAQYHVPPCPGGISWTIRSDEIPFSASAMISFHGSAARSAGVRATIARILARYDRTIRMNSSRDTAPAVANQFAGMLKFGPAVAMSIASWRYLSAASCTSL